MTRNQSVSGMRLPLHRIAAGVLVVFAASHTAGGLFGPHAYGTEGEAVFTAMKTVQFPAMGASCTWYQFWLGFGLITTLYLLFAAAVAWHLGGMAPLDRKKALPIGWALFASVVVTAVLSWVYFFPAPGVTATLAAALLGLACTRDQRLADPPASASRG